MASRVTDWRVLDEETLTEHRYIFYEIVGDKTSKKGLERRTFITDWKSFEANVDIRFASMTELERELERRTFITDWKSFEANVDISDWKSFEANVDIRFASMTELERESHSKCTEIIKEAYKNSTSRSSKGSRSAPYWWNEEISQMRSQWWNEEISQMRSQCTAARRRYAKTNGKERGEEERQRAQLLYRDSKRALRKLIRISKREHWKQRAQLLYRDSKRALQHWKRLCSDLNRDIWGDGYKIAVKGLKNFTPGAISNKDRKEAIKHLFPNPTSQTENYKLKANVVPAFTAVELKEALNKMKIGKAPGLDGIPMEAIKTRHSATAEEWSNKKTFADSTPSVQETSHLR
ncbi:hypothetical protein QE152_g34174 [Popillia japonica]|uniref:Uncharacterized protein n=1 Tax=Popillia japonica TaxID=7064 RepID=A0AAW1IUV0_POPJA